MVLHLLPICALLVVLPICTLVSSNTFCLSAGGLPSEKYLCNLSNYNFHTCIVPLTHLTLKTSEHFTPYDTKRAGSRLEGL